VYHSENGLGRGDVAIARKTDTCNTLALAETPVAGVHLLLQLNDSPQLQFQILYNSEQKKNALFGIAARGWIHTTTYIKLIEIAW